MVSELYVFQFTIVELLFEINHKCPSRICTYIYMYIYVHRAHCITIWTQPVHCSNLVFPSLLPDFDPRPPPIIHQGPQNQTLPINSVAMLQCSASGDPPPTIRWYKDNRILTQRDPRLALLDSGTLQISGKGTSQSVAPRLHLSF